MTNQMHSSRVELNGSPGSMLGFAMVSVKEGLIRPTQRESLGNCEASDIHQITLLVYQTATHRYPHTITVHNQQSTLHPYS